MDNIRSRLRSFHRRDQHAVDDSYLRPQSADSRHESLVPSLIGRLSFNSLAHPSREQSPAGRAGSLAWDSVNLDLAGNAPSRAASQAEDLGAEVQGQSRSPGRASSHSHSSQLEEPPLAGDQPEGVYITEGRLLEFEAYILRAIEASCVQARFSITDSIPSYLEAAEERMVKATIDAVAAEYNRVGINCIERGTAARNEIGRISASVQAMSNRLVSLQNTVTSNAQLGARISHCIEEVQQNIADCNSRSSMIANVREELSNDISNLAHSIRALSVRLGRFEEDFARRSQYGSHAEGAVANATSQPAKSGNPQPQALLAVPQPTPRHMGEVSLCPPHNPSAPPIPRARTNPPSCRESRVPQDDARFEDGGAGERPRSYNSSGSSTGNTLRVHRLRRRITLTVDLVRSITNKDLMAITSKARAQEVVVYDLPQVRKHSASLSAYEKEWDKLGEIDDETSDLLDIVSQEIIGWERSVTDLQKRFYMHLQGSSNLLKRVELSPFTGDPQSDTVYQFLETFHRLADSSCDPSQQADLLFNSYLSPDIQLEVAPFKTHLERVEQWLVAQYGDLRRIADVRLAKVASLKHPAPNQSAATHIEYYKAVFQLLTHLESLAQDERVDQSEITHVIFNASWITQLVSRLPEATILTFTKALEKEPRIPPPSGRRHFEILKTIIDSTWRELHTADRIRTARDPGAQVASKGTQRMNTTSDTHPPIGDKPDKGSSKKSSNRNKQGTCPMHGSSVSANHSLGECFTFFKASNRERVDLCKAASCCFSCLKQECPRVSPSSCITSQLPKELICSDCAKKSSVKRPFNVLLCSNTNHAKPSLAVVKDALVKYLGFKQHLADHLKPVFNISVGAAQLKCSKTKAHASKSANSKSSPVDNNQKVPAFDTATGADSTPRQVRTESQEDSVYIFQTILVGNRPALVFYDSGATGNLVRGSFAEAAGFKVLDQKSQLVGALANTTMWTGYGIYSAMLGDEDSGDFYHLSFQGITNITTEFPRYDLGTITQEVRASGRISTKEKLPEYVGGSPADILIGIKCSEVQPRLLFTLPSGIGVYRCQFRDKWGSSIAFGGPHSVISAVNKRFYGFAVTHMTAFLTGLSGPRTDCFWLGVGEETPSMPLSAQYPVSKYQTACVDSGPLSAQSLITSSNIGPPIFVLEGDQCKQHASPSLGECVLGAEVCPQTPLVGASVVHDPLHPSRVSLPADPPPCHKAKIPLAKIRQIMDGDNEPVVSYRCPKCEDCPACRASPSLKSSSLRERAEQKLIEASVRIDYSQQKTYIRYPFLSDPVSFFKKHFRGRDSNFPQARAVFLQQCKKSEPDKLGIRSEMQKLLDAGFIAPLDDLPANVQSVVTQAEVTHYFPWRSVSKPDSLSTPTRLVVDPSMSLFNLNVAKGDPQLASMFSILLKARSKPFLWSADIKKLYNMLVLETECLPYSLFLYNPSLNPSEEPKVYVLLRAWYGIASTAGQATFALKSLGLHHKDSHPLGARVLLEDAYVDDLLPATLSRAESDQQVSEVKEILQQGGMALKFVAHSHEAPPELASTDADSMAILGYRYFSETDQLALNAGEINFSKKVRGAKAPNPFPCTSPDSIGEAIRALGQLTRRHVVAKSAELFDPVGLLEPYKAMLKRALSSLNSIQWDDPIPADQLGFWTEQLQLWPEFKDTLFHRSTVPLDAVTPLQLRLICNTDASTSCAGACVYASYKLKSGSWSSRLLTAKSKLVDYSVPRNELEAVVLGVELCFAVAVSLDIPIQSVTIASDSLVAIAWAMNDRARNKTFVFNRVLTINRYLRWIRDRLDLDGEVELVHIPGELNAADCLTKGTITLRQIGQSSQWQDGLSWMSLEIHQMPLTRYADITLSKDEVTEFLSETMSSDPLFVNQQDGPTSYCLYPTSSPSGEVMACVVNPGNPVLQSHPAQSILSSCCTKGMTHSSSLMDQENAEFKAVGASAVHLIDPIHHGWAKSNRILKVAVKFVVKLCHNAHVHSANKAVAALLKKRCTYCIVGSALLTEHPGLDVLDRAGSDSLSSPPETFPDSLKATALTTISDIVVKFYWDSRCSLICKSRLPSKDLSHYEEDEKGILFYKGRLAQDSKISVVDLDLLDLSFLDGHEINFCNPCIMPDSIIFYSYVMWLHLKSTPHVGLESTLLELSKRFHPVRPRKTLTRILADCTKCKILRRQVLKHEMAKHNAVRTTLAPPFTFIMCDIAQNFMTKSRFSGRQTMKAPALIVCCLMSGATAIYMMEDWSTTSVVQAVERHGCKYGFPLQIFVDAGSQLKRLSSVAYSIIDLTTSVRKGFDCEVIVAPPKSHSSQGRIERRIGLIKSALEKVTEKGLLLSFLNWETLFSRIANDLNNLPIARASSTGVTRPEWGILTPNRLLIGRNNKRSLSGPLIIDSDPSAILDRVSAAQKEWYSIFLKQLHLFIPSPKWFDTDHVAVGDVVLFFIETQFKSTGTVWHYGLVTQVDGLRLTIEYTVPPSNTKKSLERSKRDVVRIAPESELDFNSSAHAMRMMDR